MNENLERQAQEILLAFKNDFENLNIEFELDVANKTIHTSQICLNKECITKSYTFLVSERDSKLGISFTTNFNGKLKDKYVESCVLANKIKNAHVLDISVRLSDDDPDTVHYIFFKNMDIASKESGNIDYAKVTKSLKLFVGAVEDFEVELRKLINGQLKIEELL